MDVQIKEKMSLPELAQAQSNLIQILAESGGELTPELEAQLNELDLKTAAKIDSYYFLIEKLESDGDFYAKLAEEPMSIATACRSLAKSLKKRIQFGMEAMGVKEIAGNLKRAQLQAAKASLELVEAEVPEEYKIREMKEVITIDKAAIRAKLENFEEVPGAKLTGGFSMRFYNVKVGKKS